MKHLWNYSLLGLAISLALYLPYHFLSDAPYFGDLADALLIATVSFGTLCAYRTYNSFERARDAEAEAFLFLTVGLALWLAAEVTWTFYEIVLSIDAPVPSVADTFWLVGYLPFTYGLYLVFEKVEFHKKAAAIAIVIYAVLGIILVPFLQDTIIKGDAGILSNLVNSAYVLLDAVLLALSVPLLVLAITSPIGRAWALIAFSILVGAIADIWFAQLNALDAYTPDHIVNYLYMLDYFWFGIGALLYLQEKKEQETEKISKTKLR
ncbi:MAG: hypothetical protein V1861_07040 [Candidatus Micrarchaeota archaeon]